MLKYGSKLNKSHNVTRGLNRWLLMMNLRSWKRSWEKAYSWKFTIFPGKLPTHNTTWSAALSLGKKCCAWSWQGSWTSLTFFRFFFNQLGWWKKWCPVVWVMCHFANNPFIGVLGLWNKTSAMQVYGVFIRHQRLENSPLTTQNPPAKNP